MIFQGRFAGRTAVVTGGASGLGKASAARIVAEGGKVVLWDLNADALAAAADEVGAIHVAALDVSDADAVAAAAEQANQALGRIDILVASAGITGATVPVHEFPIDSWKRVVDINLNGVFYCSRAIVPFMLANGYGRIVNVASVAGKEGNPNASAYSASKAGVIGFTKSLGKAAIAAKIPFLPGTATAGDIMRGMDLGIDRFKFFPAATSGGIPALKALAGPFGQARFCPTGGISLATAPDWLTLEAVLCVGGSWVVPSGPLDPARIETLAREAAALSCH